MTRYIAIISAPAQALDAGISAQTHPVIECTEEESVFMYMDTASSRAEIGAVADKLKLARVAILGLGGTGSYVLDLVAKTPVGEIHLFDADVFSQHNAFRSPGAASVTELRQKLPKVEYFRARYSNMHRHIIAHPYFMSSANLGELAQMDFVFICMDKGAAKAAIVERLERMSVRFVDVGMGVQLTDGALGGLLKVTTSTPAKRDHFRGRVSFTDGGGHNEYDKNIQVADLNAMNAALAVIKWKKLFGFYHDEEKEHYSLYSIGGNMVINEDANAA
jgi:molybdopterin/thiamine biosynthesis adenylyltransferase